MRSIVLALVLSIAQGPSLAQAADGFTYTAAIPFINAIQPNTGPIGISVNILGSNFTGATAINFCTSPTVACTNNPATSFTVNNSNSITAVVPNGTGTVTVYVTTPAGTSVPPN